MVEEKKYAGFFCPAPWESVVLQEEGVVQLCSCTAWIPHPVGNLNTQEWEEIWNGDKAQAIRASILDGSFRYCDANVCPHLNGAKGLVRRVDSVTDPKHRKIIDERRTRAEAGPTFAQISYDPTCNLTCPSCRCGRIVAKGGELTKIQAIHQKVEQDVLPSLERLDLCGQGEVFASRVYLPILRNFSRARYPKLKIWLTTNGTLLSERMWESIQNSHEAIHAIHVSINSATRDTFLTNQEGGDWDRFLENMAFIGKLRSTATIQELTFGYYVQQNNFREMAEILSLVDRFHVDKVYFANMTNWGTYSDAVFREHAVHLPEHPEHEAFKAVLRDPALQDPRIHLGNLMRFLPSEEGIRQSASADLPVHNALELCRALSLDEISTAAVCDLINRTKELFVTLIGCLPKNGDESPLAYLVRFQSLAHTNTAAEEMSRHVAQFSHRLQAMQPADHDKSYAELAGELSLRCQRWLEASLPEAARKQLRSAGTIDWIAIESTTNPLGDTVARMQAQQTRADQESESTSSPSPKRVQQLQQEWQISAATAQMVLSAVNELKGNMADWCAVPSGAEKCAPIDILAKALAESQPKAQQQFQAYLRHATPSGAQESYAIILHRLELETRSTMQSAIPYEQWQLLHAHMPKSLFQLDTGFDPMGELLARRINSAKSIGNRPRSSRAL